MNICLLGYRSNPFSGGQGVYLYYLSRALVEAGLKWTSSLAPLSGARSESDADSAAEPRSVC